LNLRNIEDLEYICKAWRYIIIPIRTERNQVLIFLQLYLNQNKEINTLGLSEDIKASYLNCFQESQTRKLDPFVAVFKLVLNDCQMLDHYK
jgi:hypothetical protein